MAGLSFALFVKYGLTVSFVIYFAYLASLLVVIVIDYYHQIIPDVISLPGIVLGFAVSFILPNIFWLDSLIGLVVGGGIFYSIALAYYLLTKRQGMGGGDIKLLAMLGAFHGWQALPFIILCSSLLGTLVGVVVMIKDGKGTQAKIPFGPFLAVASIVFLFFSEEIQWFLYSYLHGY